MVNYKKKYEALKSQNNIDKKITEHKKKHIHIPFSWGWLGRFFALLGCIALSVLNFILLDHVRNIFNVWDDNLVTNFNQLIILYPLLGEYFLISATAICLVALIKGGFDKIKTYDEECLIYYLIVGLIIGLFFGLLGLIIGLFFGLITGLITGLIVGLIIGLFGLIIGLFFGLIEEFE